LLLDLSDNLSVTRLIEALDELGNLVHGLWWRKSGGIHDDQAVGCKGVFLTMSRAASGIGSDVEQSGFFLAMSVIIISQGLVEVEFVM
jgi:hypothetical protein